MANLLLKYTNAISNNFTSSEEILILNYNKSKISSNTHKNFYIDKLFIDLLSVKFIVD